MNPASTALDQHTVVNRAFSKQSSHYDVDDLSNPILTDMRLQVYAHVAQHISPGSHILELNAGTGIDALHFANLGYTVHATDLSTGMIAEIRQKIIDNGMHERMTSQQISYDALDKLKEQKFDYVFSNFGGLNCIKDLSDVTRHLSQRLNEGAYVTWVIMPPVYFWELLWIFKANFRAAFRRLHTKGVIAHLEGEYFKTYYHSLASIKKAFGKEFRFIRSEGLCVVSPPPAPGNFPLRNPTTYALLRRVDRFIRSTFPFNRTGDHLIVTFQKT